MKSILLSIKPEWLVKILNKEKTIEVRKLFPKDYVGWVYLYCSKDTSKGYLVELYDHSTDDTLGYSTPYYEINKYKGCDIMPNPLNGTVVARFWCDKVETLGIKYGKGWETDTMTIKEIEQNSCLDRFKLYDYLQGKNGYAIHISKLEIFDKPKELNEFYKVGFKSAIGQAVYIQNKSMRNNRIDLIESEYKITKAPQNYCYVEGEQKCQNNNKSFMTSY